MAPPNLAALRHYAQLSHSASAPAPTTTTTTPPPSPPTDNATPYDTTLTHAIQSLRRLILDEELALSTLRQQLPPTPKTPLQRLTALRKAHDAAFQTLDHIPPATSPLNHLLAHRSLTTVIARTTASLSAARTHLASLTQTHAAEAADLASHRRLHAALQARLDSQPEGGEEEEAGQGGVEALRQRRREIARRTAAVLRELRWFVGDGGGLARMLVAEGAGGPVVGEALGVDPGAGFDRRGRSVQGRDPQQRIDEMWGAEGEPGESEEKKTAREFMEMLEELMNASLSTDPYVPLHKDTAVVRFLVRAKVAAFHPKDARRLRLVDFGSSVEDG